MPSQNTDKKKELFIEQYKERSCHIGETCEAVGISRRTYNNWLNDDESFNEKIWEVEESDLDDTEAKHRELINGITIGQYDSEGNLKVYEQPPCKTSIIFKLKTKGKKRGYVEKQEIEHSGEMEVSFNLNRK